MLPGEDRLYKLPIQQNARHCHVQVKFTLEEAVRYSFTVSLTSTLDRGWWPTPRSGRLAPAPVSTGEENLAPTGPPVRDNSVVRTVQYSTYSTVCTVQYVQYSMYSTVRTVQYSTVRTVQYSTYSTVAA